MPDPYVAPDDETPTQRRQRLLNLNNPAWQPTPDAVDETAGETAPALAAPEPEPPAAEMSPTKPARSTKDK